MKKIVFCLALSLCSFGTFAQYYSNSFPTPGANPGRLNSDGEFPFGGGLATGWVSIIGPSVTTPVWSVNQTIPFAFNFDGVPVTQYKVSSTGVLTFTTSAITIPSATTTALPSASIPDKSVCVWGIEATGANDNVVVKTFGTAPNRQQWVFFASHALGGSGWSYWSIVMEETTDKIYIVDQRHSGTTGGVSMGVQINSTTAESIGANVLPLAGGNSAAADNAYYEFIQGTRASNDIEMVSLGFNTVTASTANSISGAIRNLGSSTLTSYTLSYTVDGGAPFTSVIMANLAPQATVTFSHPTTWSPAPGVYTLNVYTELPNGITDANSLNDSIAELIASGSGNSVSRNVLLEEFTTESCGFCPDGGLVVEQVLASNPSVIAVAEHACFGTDQYTISEASAYCAAFGSGAPTATIDRVLFSGETNVAIGRSIWAAQSLSRASTTSPVDISITGVYDNVTRQASVNINSTFVDYVTGDIRLTLFVVEDSLLGDQTSYYNTTAGHTYFGAGNPIVNYTHRHTLRDVYPTTDAWGDATTIPNTPVLNTIYTKNFSFTVNSAWKEKDITLVAFVSYYSSNTGQREVLNAGEVHLTNIITNLNKVLKDESSLKVYPNPSASVTNFEINLSEVKNVNLTLRDITGKVILFEKFGQLAKGRQLIKLDVNDLTSGFYFATLQLGKATITRKISIMK